MTIAQPKSVSPAALRELMDGRWHAVRDRGRQLANEPQFAPVTDLSVDDYRARILEQMQDLAKSGEPRMGFPEYVDGRNDVGGSVVAFEMLAMGDMSLLVKAGVQWGLFGGAVLHLGTQRHHDKYLGDILALDLLGCFAMTETGHGSDVAAVQTTATYDDEAQEFVINTPTESARKDYIGNAARDGHIAAVFAQLHTPAGEQGVHAFLVPIRSSSGKPMPGVRIEDCGLKAGLNGVDNGRLWFDHVRIPRENLLNRYGDVAEDGTYSTPIKNKNKRFFTMLGTLIQGRISIAGGSGSATKVALAIALRYAEQRRQFSAPDSSDEVVILDYLAHQRKLLPALATTYALHFAQAQLVELLHDVFTTGAADDPRRRRLEAQAAGIKAVTTWHATQTIQTCREACGGAGYLASSRLPQLKADTDVFTTFEGDNTVLLQLVAKELLTNYRDEFGELDWLGTVRFVADQVTETVIERTAARPVIQRLRDIAPLPGDETKLRDRAWHVDLFNWREKHLLDSLARRLRRAAGARDPFTVFNAAQVHMLAAARAHVERLMLDAFISAIDSCRDEAVRELLDLVCDLFVLSTIEADRAWFLEHGRLTRRRSKAITGLVDELCATLRPSALTLVAGFGIPEAALATELKP